MIFEGNTKIYLEGKNALSTIASPQNDHMSYYLGEEKSQLIVHDFRHPSIEAAKNALQGKDVFDFADVFNQPALAKIYHEDDSLVIELSPQKQKNGKFPILWMGLFNDNMMPMNQTKWEVLRPITDKKTAFVALIPTT